MKAKKLFHVFLLEIWSIKYTLEISMTELSRGKRFLWIPSSLLTKFVPFLYHWFMEENCFCLSSWGRWCFKVGLKDKRNVVINILLISFHKCQNKFVKTVRSSWKEEWKGQRNFIQNVPELFIFCSPTLMFHNTKALGKYTAEYEG